MIKARKEKLEKVLSKGKNRFVLFNGVFVWGVLTAILFLAFQYLIGSAQSSLSLLVCFVIFPFFGYFWGLFMWRYINTQYEKM